MEPATSKDALDHLVFKHENRRLYRGIAEAAVAAALVPAMPGFATAVARDIGGAIEHASRLDTEGHIAYWGMMAQLSFIGSIMAYHAGRCTLDGLNNIIEGISRRFTDPQPNVTYRRGFTVRPGPFDRIAGRKVTPIERFSDIKFSTEGRQPAYFINGVLFQSRSPFKTELAVGGWFDSSPHLVHNMPVMGPLLRADLRQHPSLYEPQWALLLPAQGRKGKYLKAMDWGHAIYAHDISGYRKKHEVREERTDLAWQPVGVKS